MNRYQKKHSLTHTLSLWLLSINQSINLFVNLSLSQSNETVSKIHDRTPRIIQIFTYWCPPAPSIHLYLTFSISYSLHLLQSIPSSLIFFGSDNLVSLFNLTPSFLWLKVSFLFSIFFLLVSKKNKNRLSVRLQKLCRNAEFFFRENY